MLVLAALFEFLSAIVLAAPPSDSAFTEVPSRFETRELSASSRGLGEICLSRAIMPDGTACNPAYLPEAEGGHVLIRAYIGNGYSALTTAQKFLFQPLTREFLEELFKKQSVIALEAVAGLAFTTQYFSAGFVPYRVQYISEAHNPNFPIMKVSATLEQSLEFGGGVPLGGLHSAIQGSTVGLKLRILKRKYIHESFSLIQVLTEKPDTFLPIRSQTAVFLDPHLGWKFENVPWTPRVSLATRNLGAVWKRDSLYPEKLDLDLGLGIAPPLPVGSFNVGLDLVDLVHAEDFASRLRFGVGYSYGMLEATAGANADALAAGLRFGFEIIHAGIVYEFLRSGITGGLSENRIATEVAIRL